MKQLELLYTAGSHQIGTITLENCLAISTKGKYIPTLWSSDFSPGHYPTEIICMRMFIIAISQHSPKLDRKSVV